MKDYAPKSQYRDRDAPPLIVQVAFGVVCFLTAWTIIICILG